MKIVNYLLIAVGISTSLGMSIYAAQPWGDNYAYQNISGYLGLILWDLWVALPFALLYLLNRRYRNSKPHLRLMFIACLIGSCFVAYIYIDSIMFSTSSTSALIFIFLPLYQLIFVAIIGSICMVISKLLNKSQQPTPTSGAAEQ